MLMSVARDQALEFKSCLRSFPILMQGCGLKDGRFRSGGCDILHHMKVAC